MTSFASFKPGISSGCYPIAGASSMGEVCRAGDTRLSRDVPVGALSKAFAAADRLARQTVRS